jgi:hypothetical protein
LKIAFLCGSLEPGQDGVGDYTRRLAGELTRQGHFTAIIALNDRAANVKSEEIQLMEDIKVPVLRIPFNYSSAKRFSLAGEWLNSFNPDWVSLQYVPYSFQNKGLPFGLRRSLQKLGKGRKWHIMFHELWIGFTKISPAKHKIVGFFQEKIAASIVRSLHPKTVTTTNRLYQLLLLKNNIRATILPLFSNIPVAPADQSFIAGVLKEIPVKDNELDQFIITGFFGNLYPEAELEKALAEQWSYAEAAKKKMICIGFGNINLEGLKEFKRLEELFLGKIKFLHLGKQSATNVSSLMQLLDTAFSCTPAQHIGKSGVFAAMKLHGVNLILPKGDSIPEYDAEIKKYNEELLKRPAPNWDVKHTTGNFSQLLTTADY